MSFYCPVCGRTSASPDDERRGWCPNCCEYTALKAGDTVRIRRWETEDDWCICSVQLASTNGLSLALKVADGVLRTIKGELMTGALAVGIDPKTGFAFEVFSKTPLDFEKERRNDKTN
jgi:hypothetical protein